MEVVFFELYIVVSLALVNVSQGAHREVSDTSCRTCQITIKELDSVMQNKLSHGVEATVRKALKMVCKKESFVNYDIDPKTILNYCKDLLGRKEVETLLTEYYTGIHKEGGSGSYLDVTDWICNEHLHMCQIEHLKASQKDGGIEIDPDTQEIKIVPGRKVRIPKAVKESQEPDDKKKSIEQAGLGLGVDVPLDPQTITLTHDSHDEL
ncbi:hypothetical protein CHS0354_039494 [Potamilus streckersoni]|uniref:Saposin B-type domain-containing protein n=1 Tax=Potamilus streckersoni TaxID=2493646 RepID=A0AAE0TL40_9BIVA|nr:hypothetical protein CHS0354_039494 [Potamilus streckersoni]